LVLKYSPQLSETVFGYPSNQVTGSRGFEPKWVRVIERADVARSNTFRRAGPRATCNKSALTVDVGAYTFPEGFVRRPAVNVFSNQESTILRISFLSLPVTIFFAETLRQFGIESELLYDFSFSIFSNPAFRSREVSPPTSHNALTRQTMSLESCVWHLMPSQRPAVDPRACAL